MEKNQQFESKNTREKSDSENDNLRDMMEKVKLYRRKPDFFYDSRQPKFVNLQEINECAYKTTFNRVQNKLFD